MTAEITTVIGQLNLKEGAWRGDAPNQVAVREPKAAGAPGAGKGDLFVLVEIRGAKNDYEVLERQLAEMVRDTYYLARGSTTASLRRALQAANEQLYRRNYKADLTDRVVGGVVALVMSGDNAFIAQAGPAALFAVLGEQIQRYPAKSVWLDEIPRPAPAKSEPALGINALIEPNLHHLCVSPEDKLVLADSRLAGQLPLNDVSRAVATPNIKTAVKNLGKVAQTSNGSALALLVIEAPQSALGSLLKKAAPPSSLPPTPPSSSRAEAAPVAVAVPPLEPELALETSAHSQPALKAKGVVSKPHGWFDAFSKKPDPAKSGLTDQTQVADLVEDELPSISLPPTRVKEYERDTFIKEEYDWEEKKAREARAMAAAARQSTFESELYTDKPAASLSGGHPLRWLGAGLLMFIALLSSGLKTVLLLVSPNSNSQGSTRAGTQAYRRQASPGSWILLRNIALAIPLLVAVIVAVSYWQKGRMREAEYSEFVTNAQNKFQQAQAADPSTALGLVAEAETLLIEAEKIKGTQPEITDLRLKMAAETDRVGKVQRLYYLSPLRQYTDEGTNLKTVLVQGVEVYVMDAGTGRIFHHRLDDMGEALLPDDETLLLVSRGQVVDSVTVGDLVGMAWVTAAGNRQTSDLVALSRSSLLEYNSNWGITTSTLAGLETLVAPVAVDSFFGNFYILDPSANRLWRYLPTPDGYSAQPESYFPAEQAIDLTNAIDLSIDGAIYVLFKDGRISKFEGGQPVGFNITGLDKPFSNPVSIFTAPDEAIQHVYVADAGNRRIVQLNKDGSFVRQFKPREGEAVSFANLQDVFVDEISGRFYILDSNNLYVGNIPSE